MLFPQEMDSVAPEQKESTVKGPVPHEEAEAPAGRSKGLHQMLPHKVTGHWLNTALMQGAERVAPTAPYSYTALEPHPLSTETPESI